MPRTGHPSGLDHVVQSRSRVSLARSGCPPLGIAWKSCEYPTEQLRRCLLSVDQSTACTPDTWPLQAPTCLSSEAEKMSIPPSLYATAMYLPSGEKARSFTCSSRLMSVCSVLPVMAVTKSTVPSMQPTASVSPAGCHTRHLDAFPSSVARTGLRWAESQTRRVLSSEEEAKRFALVGCAASPQSSPSWCAPIHTSPLTVGPLALGSTSRSVPSVTPTSTRLPLSVAAMHTAPGSPSKPTVRLVSCSVFLGSKSSDHLTMLPPRDAEMRSPDGNRQIEFTGVVCVSRSTLCRWWPCQMTMSPDWQPTMARPALLKARDRNTWGRPSAVKPADPRMPFFLVILSSSSFVLGSMKERRRKALPAAMLSTSPSSTAGLKPTAYTTSLEPTVEVRISFLRQSQTTTVRWLSRPTDARRLPLGVKQRAETPRSWASSGSMCRSAQPLGSRVQMWIGGFLPVWPDAKIVWPSLSRGPRATHKTLSSWPA
mmetsp:Transcript_1983/g.6572  ORF Transcript_1983/g.6572 Transcript_1983/m.6572 type:complete len:483 (-) Transcript_1983:171-1619(-)